ncbi:hypothetical protein [Sulfuriroseicoccus oceanibius]|uniref:Uncharacterized protein n=1 Tax=Sulfuriroseicoccus oceanibius TaxID=2707525 RepID=A0A6B3L6L3_9BACT|nr:hypothetical protein [Sulfuriroseicoccus oceanibius]QQL43702.1 hypothetical protein G3M56_007255 [Sulfuriroseicoccus oceanibius]
MIRPLACLLLGSTFATLPALAQAEASPTPQPVTESAPAEENSDEPAADESWKAALIPKVATSSADHGEDVVVGRPVATNNQSKTPGKVYLPYAPRPKTPLPPGWEIRPSETLPPITRKVQLDNGRIVTLRFPTFIIVPASEADGALKFADPGFDPRTPEQSSTVSSVLKSYAEEAEQHQKNLDAALREIEQVILSTPRPATNR